MSKGNLEKPESKQSIKPTSSSLTNLPVPDWVVKKIRDEYREHLLYEIAALRIETVGNDDIISLADVLRYRRTAFLNVEQLVRDDVWSKKFIVAGVDKPYVLQHHERVTTATSSDLSQTESGKNATIKRVEKEIKL